MVETPPPAMQGTISAHPHGFGFVVRDDGESYFVSPPQMRSLLPGDRVAFSLLASPGREQLSALVHEVLERPESFWLGQLEPEGRGHRLRTDDPCHVALLVAPEQQPIDTGEVVQVRVAPGEGVGQPAVQATVVAKLGPRDARDFDVRYAIARWRLPVEFGAAALAEARGQAAPSRERAVELGLADLTELPFVTIDGERSKDFDDALCAVASGANLTLHVAIAHVSHYVAPGSALDDEARERSTSVYLPDRTLPMLPAELSNGLCSLKPGELRHALVCSLDYGESGTLAGYAFRPALVRSVARLTYRQVAAGELPAPAAPVLAELWRWFDSQEPARARRRLLEFRGEEPRLALADGGDAVEWTRIERSNELVEEAMLAANRAAAAHLTLLGGGLLFRHQEGLDARRWAQTRRWLCARGIQAPEAPSLVDLQALLQAVAESPLRPQVEFRVRHAMTTAVYDERQSSHFALGFLTYTHFTSPIRRYADLLVHRMLLGQPVEVGAALSDHLSARAAAARQASRYPWERLKRRSVWRSEEREHAAQVTSRSAKGVKALLARWEVAVFVAAETLERQGWAWDRGNEIWCRREAVLDLGSLVRLRLLALVDEGPTCELSGELLLPLEHQEEPCTSANPIPTSAPSSTPMTART